MVLPTLDRLAIVSPHLDDGVWSCGRLLAEHPGSSVVTVFAGFPPPRSTVTSWDAACGFKPGDDVGAARRGEDRRALDSLQARPVWLPFWDDQYGRRPTLADVVRALALALHDLAVTAVAGPLGLFHRDHELTHRAVIELASTHAWPTTLFYADSPYRAFSGEQLNARLAGLRNRGLAPRIEQSPADDGHDPAWARKRQAVNAYASQLRGLSARNEHGAEDVRRPEEYVVVTPAGAPP